MKITALFAHPDDCELWAGGTLKKHIDNGDEVNTCMFYELSIKRLEESRQALSMLEIPSLAVETPAFCIPDFRNFYDKYMFEPDIIITHWEYDTHLEHKLIFNFSLNYAHYLKRYKKKTPVFLMASTYNLVGSGLSFTPSIIVNISDQWESKKEAIMMHKSQKPELLLKDIESQNAIFGNQIKRQMAEGFIEYPLYGRRITTRRENLSDFLD